MQGRTHLSLFLLATLLAPAFAGPLGAQHQPDGPANLPGPAGSDPEEILDHVRKMQRRFERIRRQGYPWGEDAPVSCDERIGRFCMWHEDLEVDGNLTPPQLIRERIELISSLRDANASVAESRWLAGQLIRYLVESGRLAEAARTAAGCRPSGDWWCLALTGYVAHSRRKYERSEELYRQALEAMPSKERCAWSDISVMLDGDIKKRYGKLPCDARDSIAARVWWLADPLYMVAGNDRRTEHYSRHVLAELQDNAGSPFGIDWGSDLKEILVRYGWPIRFEQVLPSGISAGVRPYIISHHHPDGRRFLPPGDHVSRPELIPADGWSLEQDVPLSEYAPPYAEVSWLEHQRAVFQRNDSVMVVAAFDLGADSAMGEGLQAALVLAEDEGADPVMIVGDTPGSHMAFAVKAPARPHVFSLEALSLRAAAARRARYGITPRTSPRIVLSASDILLIEDAGYAPARLAEAIPLARGSNRVRSRERIGIFWEIYNARPGGEAVTVELTITRKGKNWLRKVGEAIGVTSKDRPMSLAWQENIEANSLGAPRSMWLEMPEMSPGTYVLRLQLNAFGREPLLVAREILVPDLPD